MKRHALKEPECHHVEDIFNCRVLCGLHYINCYTIKSIYRSDSIFQ